MAGHYPGGSLVWNTPTIHQLVFDEQIGAVEIKDHTTDDRAAVLDILGVKRLAVDASISVTIADIGVDEMIQVKGTDTVAALGAAGTFAGVSKDCLSYGGYGITCWIQRGAADANVDVIVEESDDGVTWREVDRVNLAVTAAQTEDKVGRVYSPLRQYMRTRLVNNTANALAGTELYSMLKPIP